MRRASVSLVLCCLAPTAWSCTDLEARVANELVDRAATDVLNELIRTQVSKTLGHCSDATADQLAPCKDVDSFPITQEGTDYQLEVPYVTHIDTAKLTNVSLRCDKDPRSSSPDKHFFTDIRGYFDELAVAMEVHVGFPPVTIDAPCYGSERCVFDQHRVAFNVVGRIVCHSTTAFGLELDGAKGITFDRPIQIQVSHLPAIDITKQVIGGVQKAASKAKMACPGDLATLCEIICRESDEQVALHV